MSAETATVKQKPYRSNAALRLDDASLTALLDEIKAEHRTPTPYSTS
jgi:hypothetical protein